MLATAAYGVALGLALPRGPVTTAQALTTLTASFGAGLLAGYLTRSRWAILVAPTVFGVVFELVRVGASGPTVDAVAPTSTYGVIALLVGRGFLALLTLSPLALGATLGAAATRTGRASPGGRPPARGTRYLRRTVTALLCLGLVLFGVALARPARTAPIPGADGRPLPGSIAELVRVEVGGHELGLMIRGHDVTDPVLLFLAGGPGGSELGAMRRHAQGLEEDFVVATFDQRGTGTSHHQLEPVETMTLKRAVADVVEVSRYLRDRFDTDRIYLVGQSWGSTLGVLAVQDSPALYRAFVGVGQMVSQRETDRIFRADTLAWARRVGDEALARELTAIGPPPYADVLDYETALSHEQQVYPYDHGPNSEGAGGFSENLFVEEYTLLEQVHNLGAFLDVFTILYPQLQDIDFRRSATRLEVPVYLVQGAFEARGRAVLADEWFGLLQAPHKQLVVLDTSGHRPIFEQPQRFHEVMVGIVLAQTEGRATPQGG
ncbi:alpha/beta hydrolase [Intrasporangium sp.]|uniref:alpha/beta fold hydrolase n=1 Tax=Intrasporangium sp. TaxID=1925024 RepID=UPI003221D03E